MASSPRAMTRRASARPRATLRGSGLDTADAAHISQGSQRHARSSHGRDEPAPRSHRLEKPSDQGSGSSADAKPEKPGTAASPSLLHPPDGAVSRVVEDGAQGALQHGQKEGHREQEPLGHVAQGNSC